MTSIENVVHITLFQYIVHTQRVLQPTLKIQQSRKNWGCNIEFMDSPPKIQHLTLMSSKTLCSTHVSKNVSKIRRIKLIPIFS